MTKKILKTAAIVTVRCELCNETFNYRRIISVDGPFGVDLRPSLIQALQSPDLGYHRCPHCRYLQSWMATDYRQTLLLRSIGISILCFIALIWYLFSHDRLPESAAPLTVLLFAVVAGSIALCIGLGRLLFLPPNRRIERLGPTIPASREPTFTIDRPKWHE